MGIPASLERIVAELQDYELLTPEGVRYSPLLLIEQDEHGVLRLEVGVTVRLPEGGQHEVRLVPSTATDEGDGTGNVFIYEDDEAISHVAWKEQS